MRAAQARGHGHGRGEEEAERARDEGEQQQRAALAHAEVRGAAADRRHRRRDGALGVAVGACDLGDGEEEQLEHEGGRVEHEEDAQGGPAAAAGERRAVRGVVGLVEAPERPEVALELDGAALLRDGDGAEEHERPVGHGGPREEAAHEALLEEPLIAGRQRARGDDGDHRDGGGDHEEREVHFEDRGRAALHRRLHVDGGRAERDGEEGEHKRGVRVVGHAAAALRRHRVVAKEAEQQEERKDHRGRVEEPRREHEAARVRLDGAAPVRLQRVRARADVQEELLQLVEPLAPRAREQQHQSDGHHEEHRRAEDAPPGQHRVLAERPRVHRKVDHVALEAHLEQEQRAHAAQVADRVPLDALVVPLQARRVQQVLLHRLRQEVEREAQEEPQDARAELHDRDDADHAVLQLAVVVGPREADERDDLQGAADRVHVHD